MAEYLKKIKRVLVDRAVEHTPLARRVRQRLSHLPWQVVDKQQDIAPSTDSNQVLYLKEYKGNFCVSVQAQDTTVAVDTVSSILVKIVP